MGSPFNKRWLKTEGATSRAQQGSFLYHEAIKEGSDYGSIFGSLASHDNALPLIHFMYITIGDYRKQKRASFRGAFLFTFTVGFRRSRLFHPFSASQGSRQLRCRLS
jgi:hypothetical protein